MPAKRSPKGRDLSQRKPRSTARARKGSPRATTSARPSKQTSQPKAGSISDAAARVAKSGAVLVGHAGQRVVTAAADTAKAKLDGALRSAAEATASRLHKFAGRKTKH